MTASKSSRAAAAQESESIPGQTAVNDLARQQLVAMADGASALFRASEVMQQVQQQMAQRAALMHQQAAEKLRNVNNPGELLAIQSGLMMSAFQEATQYWQELTAAGMKLQAEMMGRAGQQPQGPTGNVTTAAMSPMLQVWQNMFTAPLNSGVSASTH